jgi:uncharacterized protein YhbP (UPF0306 family)
LAKEKTLVTVRTGEYYQPARIYFQVLKQKTVIATFKKLRCMEFDAQQNRWNWLYEAEAKRLRFSQTYNAIPKEHRPLVLGYFTFPSPDQMWFDVRSFARAIYGLDFFIKRINKWTAKATHIRVVNRLFDIAEMPNQQIHPSLDVFFERDDIPLPTGIEMEARLKSLEGIEDEEARKQAGTEYVEEMMKRPHPEIEEIPLHIYEDGLGLISMNLSMRQTEAFAHWRGLEDFSAFDLMNLILSTFGADGEGKDEGEGENGNEGEGEGEDGDENQDGND